MMREGVRPPCQEPDVNGGVFGDAEIRGGGMGERGAAEDQNRAGKINRESGEAEAIAARAAVSRQAESPENVAGARRRRGVRARIELRLSLDRAAAAAKRARADCARACGRAEDSAAGTRSAGRAGEPEQMIG